MNKIQRSKCRHCGAAIRLHRGVWVHDDPDENPEAEDYGWAKCLPTPEGDLNYAELTV